MCNTFELYIMAFVCLGGGGGLLRFSVPGATEKIAGLWFIRVVSVPRLRCTTREGGGGEVSPALF